MATKWYHALVGMQLGAGAHMDHIYPHPCSRDVNHVKTILHTNPKFLLLSENGFAGAFILKTSRLAFTSAASVCCSIKSFLNAVAIPILMGKFGLVSL